MVHVVLNTQLPALRAPPCARRGRMQLITRCSTSSEPQPQPQPQQRVPPASARVIGMGGCGVDYLAQVAAYPRPDQKLRTEQLEVQGGGNCGNALTAAARLGLQVAIVSKIGGDSVGDGIVAEFERDGVSTQHLLRAEGAPSPFTYIIVDREGGTRTCIHTPSEPMRVDEMPAEAAACILEGAALVYFDGRLTEPALELARAARAKGVPVLVEGERLRPGLDELLSLADFVVTSAHFPQEWTGEESVGDAMLSTFHRLPQAQWIVTTLGARGAVLMERPRPGDPAAADPTALESGVLEDLLQVLFAEAASGAGMPAAPPPSGHPQPACRSSSGVEVGEGGVAGLGAPRRLRLRRGSALGGSGQDAEQRRAKAAALAAAANADAGNAAGYSGGSGSRAADEELVASVSVASAARLPEGAVADTTGAGDSFIGSLLYSLATRQPLPAALRLAAVVAACNCTALGARTGMPQRAQLRVDLL